MSKRYQVIVIGAGQAGIAIGYQLKRAQLDFVMLDAGARVGDAWRNRWDSLRLFTAAEFSGLPGLSFPGDPDVRPGKDAVADYLEHYARLLRLPIRLNVRVTSVSRSGETFIVETPDEQFEADQVVVAAGPYQKAILPEWSSSLDGSVTQLHSSAYRNPSQLPPGRVLVVGAGNTGAELALEAAHAGHEVWLAGRDVGQVPPFFRWRNGRIFWFLATRVLTARTPMGRAIKRTMRAHRGAPLVRIHSKEIDDAGIKRIGRVVGVREGLPLLEDGRVLDVAAVLWCSGYRMDFSWIQLPIFEQDGYPKHESGRVPSQPGLYFIGLPFQHSLASSTLVGVPRDAVRVAEWIVERASAPRAMPRLAVPAHRAS